MSGTTLTQTQFALLSASVLQCLPEGITIDVLNSWRRNHEELRERLAFLVEMAPLKHKPNTITVKPAKFFVASDRFRVDPNFIKYIDLSPCTDDPRQLKFLYTFGTKTRRAVAIENEGSKAFIERRATLPQLMRELKLVLSGGRSVFKKGDRSLFYLLNRNSQPCPIIVHWNDGELTITYLGKVREGRQWHVGDRICGN